MIMGNIFRTILIFVALLIFAPAINSQVVVIYDDSPAPQKESTSAKKPRKSTTLNLDTAEYKITYKTYFIPDTSNFENKRDGFILTLVGDKYAKFIDKARQDAADIRMKMRAEGKSANEVSSAAINALTRQIFFEEIIIDYPNKGTNSVKEYLAGTMRRYEDDGAIQDWKIGDETKDYLGYNCRKATCHYRGRDYEAWYAEELPIPYGPFVFHGLPGLIVELSDTNKEYNFALVGIEKPSKPISLTLSNGKSIDRITREEFRKLKEYYNSNVAASFLDGNIHSTVNEEKRKQMEKDLNYARPYNPIELE